MNYEVTYEMNNEFYTVTGSAEFHSQLQNDSKFCEAYFKTLRKRKYEFSDDSDDALEYKDQDETQNNNNLYDDPIPSTSSTATTYKSNQGETQINNYDDPSTSSTHQLPALTYQSSNMDKDGFIWTRKATLLLLNSYKEKSEMFRNSKIKNKNIWLQILSDFIKQGYHSATVEILDRKMRNLKRTYKGNKDKKNKTGESTIQWEFFDVMEEIFHNDKSINPPTSIIASMGPVGVSNPVPVLNASEPTLPTGTDEILKICQEKDTINKGSKAKRNKHQLYEHRKKILEMERERIEELRRLREAIERNNEIQQERNEILKKLIKN